MCELQRFIVNNQMLCFLDLKSEGSDGDFLYFCKVSFGVDELIEFLHGRSVRRFEHITAISKGSHGVDIEGVFSHTDCVLLQYGFLNVRFLEDFFTIIFRKSAKSNEWTRTFKTSSELLILNRGR